MLSESNIHEYFTSIALACVRFSPSKKGIRISKIASALAPVTLTEYVVLYFGGLLFLLVTRTHAVPTRVLTATIIDLSAISIVNAG